MKSINVEIQRVAEATRLEVFTLIVPIDLASIFTGYSFLPAVTGVSNQRGCWDGIGQNRTVLFSDGSSAQETLTTYQLPVHFGYDINRFTGILRWLTHSMSGSWWFDDDTSDQTLITWRYTFRPRSPFLYPLVWCVAQGPWRGYMTKALRLATAQLMLQGN